MKKKILVKIFFLVTLITFLLLEKQLKAVADISTILDMKIFYNETFVRRFFNSLGHSGREMYHKLHIVDYIFIFALGSIQFVFLNEKLLKIGYNTGINKGHFFIPIFLRGIADIGENIIIDMMLSSYPIVEFSLVKIASITTFLKWIFLICFVLEILYLIILEKRNRSTFIEKVEC